MVRVFLDTAPIIYLAEGEETRCDSVAKQLTRWIESETTLGTSTLTLLELLVVPKRQKNRRLERKYRALLTTFLSEPLIPMDSDIADLAAEIRADYRFKTPDAIQLATAVIHGYEVIYTNDQRFEQFPDLDVILVDPEK